ncbi:hypothetical protein COV93_02430 [Candidatus Woesearchaeota archaeon CG11_big_fil_rev_8_21_14_0_20_43_8]|nr:MAG: hypothetical protein COV93_02430 [Candidatus Woesearchaeota archaeon CG11_big_fil_rev_8_21_14_0_20_43_8]PIO06778.1 MAG: hypothetical protein COT47_02765 [Candidatus Woesearchaeota archaeon CG08_land_8_20_14_0_20_43_7]
MYEKRKQELIYLLKDRKEEIDLSRQHQIYGAVKEIELFLETIRYFIESAEKEEFENVILPKPENRNKGFLSKMRDQVRNRLVD